MHDFIVNVSQAQLAVLIEILFCEWSQQNLDIIDGQNVFKIVDKGQHQQMLFCIFLLHRRREKVVLGIVVYHGFGQNLVVRVALGGGQVILHESGYLIHI